MQLVYSQSWMTRQVWVGAHIKRDIEFPPWSIKDSLMLALLTDHEEICRRASSVKQDFLFRNQIKNGDLKKIYPIIVLPHLQ